MMIISSAAPSGLGPLSLTSVGTEVMAASEPLEGTAPVEGVWSELSEREGFLPEGEGSVWEAEEEEGGGRELAGAVMAY